jgi:hypothetical protein
MIRLLPTLVLVCAMGAQDEPRQDGRPPKGVRTAEDVVPTDQLASEPAPVTVTSQPGSVGSVRDAFDLPEISEVRRYAMRQIVTSQVRNPSPFSSQEWLPTQTLMWSVVEWFQTGQEVWYTETLCGLKTKKVFGTRTEYPQAFLDAVPVRERRATMTGDGRGSMFMTEPYAQTLGIELAAPLTDPLPSAVDDPRLRDADGDGHPGVSIRISHPLVGTGEVYVAQRSIARLEGFQEHRGRIRGVLYTKADTLRLGASRWWLMADTPQRPHPDPAESPFLLVPADHELDCGRLMSSLEQVFADEG